MIAALPSREERKLPSREERKKGAAEIALGGAALVADASGALYWPRERLLVVADMHLEKGSSFARSGQLLPPYDTRATLARLGGAIGRYDPRAVLALGDSFHDGDGPARLADDDRGALVAMQRGRDWIWLAGNHDPDPAVDIGGIFSGTLTIGPLTFRHEPTAADSRVEIAGHLHPVARVAARGRSVSRRCFAGHDRRLVMPAFGAYAGGLNVRHRAFADVFGTLAFTAHLLGEARVFAVAGANCLPD
ncbi:MAG TPA: ligase-associated DNA damage response endonuclease PdeM [Pseudorhodoplanes sp.]|nr:ligase-associated DNA damage response endonuclease PdeM [Pseudorhodoplanes sp.]